MTLRLPLAGLFVALSPLVGCASPGASTATADPAVLTSVDQFVDYLRREGVVVSSPEYSSTSNFIENTALNGSVTSYLVRFGASGEESVVIIYPFVSPEAAENNVFPIAEDRAIPGIGGRRFEPRDKQTYQNGSLVVVYYGRDSSIRSTLRNALGLAKRR